MISIPVTVKLWQSCLVLRLWTPRGHVVVCARAATFYKDAMYPPEATCIALWDVTISRDMLRELEKTYCDSQLNPPCLRVMGRRFNHPRLRYSSGCFEAFDGMLRRGGLNFVGYEEIELDGFTG